MNRIEYLRYQIERARRFAATLTDVEDRERFQGAADDYQREIDALSSTDTTSAGTSAPPDAIAVSGESDTAASSDATAASNGGDAIPSTIDTGPQETD